jgi:4-aminobutyrate aminotransferase-like enzyme
MSFSSIQKRYSSHILKPVVNKISLVSGKGVHVFDDAGNSYLDFTIGGGISLLGYNNRFTKRVQSAILAQMERMPHIPHYIYYSEPAAALAEKLADIAPDGLNKMFFCNSGSEAVEGAIRTVRKFKKKFELLALQKGFMGRTMGTVSLTGLSRAKKGIGPLLPGIYHLPAPHCRQCSLNHTFPTCELACARYLEDFLDYGTSGNVAALIAEPILGDAGVIVPPPGYFGVLANICRCHDIAFVADETLTGMGRTGKMFGIEHEPIHPEIMTVGKAVGGGLPLGAFIVSERVAEIFEYDDFSSTAGGNPMACAAGLTTIELIESEGLLLNADSMGAYLMSGLKQVASVSGFIGDVRGRGLLLGFEIVDPETGLSSAQLAGAVKEELVAQGFLLDIFGVSSIRLTPPLIIAQKHIDKLLDRLAKIFNRLR